MRLFLWLAGTDEDVLAKCPSERRKMAATGAMVATTGCLAAVAATFTIYRFMRTSLIVGLIAGLAWGVAILTLDRWLVMSIRRQPTRRATLLLALPRVALAVVAGLVIATPIVLKAFEREVTTQAGEDKRQAFLAGKHRLDLKYAEISSLENDSSRLVHKIANVETGTALERNPAYQGAAEETQRLRSEAQAARSGALCELDGSCGTHHVGEGAAYRRKAARAASLESQAARAAAGSTELRRRLLGEESAKSAEAAHSEHRELGEVETRLHRLREERGNEEAVLRHEYRRPIGLADRLDALSVLSRSHPSVANWSRFVTLLILFFDTAPALGKAFMAMGEPTLYERELERYETTVSKKGELTAAAELEAHSMEARIAVDEAELKRDLWKQEMQGIVSKKVAVEAEMARLYISEWERHVREQTQAWIKEAFRRYPASEHHATRAEDEQPVRHRVSPIVTRNGRPRLRRRRPRRRRR
jgi:hypothetical protein